MSVATEQEREIVARILGGEPLARPEIVPDVPPPTVPPPFPPDDPPEDDPKPPKPARNGGGRNGAGGDVGDSLNREMAFRPLTDLGNAERFRDRNRGRFIWNEALGWLWWTGRSWSSEGADSKVQLAVHLTVRAIQDEAKAIRGTADDKVIAAKANGRKTETKLSDALAKWGRESEKAPRMNAVGVQARGYLEVKTEQLDADPLCINCANGTLFIRKPGRRGDHPLPERARNVEPDGYRYFVPHHPGDYCTKITSCDYVPDAPAEKFDAFFAEVQPEPPARRQLMAWRGYSLTGDVSEQKLCVFYGFGRNGKSVFEEVCSHVAGDYAASTPIETFIDEGRGRNAGQATPDLAKLPGVRMLRTSEPNRRAKLNEGLIKLATGGEPISARHLNRPYFDFYPLFKLTISGNHRPQIGGTDEGIWRRILLIPWAVTIPPERQNPYLALELREEASGVLCRMIDGLCDWLDNGLPLAAATLEATAEYRRDSDQLGRFLEACVVHAPGERVQSSTLHEVFNAWCLANSGSPWKGRSFSDAMTERGYKKTKSSVVFFIDIKLTKTLAEFEDSEGRPIGTSRRRRPPKNGDSTPAGDDFVM